MAAWVIGGGVYAAGAPYRIVVGLVAALVGGVLVLNAIGILGMMWRADLSIGAATKAAAVFMPGDVVKAVLTALIARGVHAAYPGLLPRRRREPVAAA